MAASPTVPPMDEAELDSMTATGALAAMAAGRLGSEELLDAHLARIEATNPTLNAVVATDTERARDRCRQADDARARGESWGPLHGLPMTIKDSYETEGIVTTSGAPDLAGHVPDTDADAVDLLRRGGAVVFAKTNLPLYAGDIQTFNDVYGLTRNPYDPERTVGGSSGGAAAALAAGYTLLELGSDIGGSIRCPAHYCGVAGIKPSWWVISKRGHIPGPPGARRAPDLSVAGPMARSVADLELAMDVLTVDGVHSVPGARLPEASPAVATLEGCRVGVWSQDPTGPIGADVAATLDRLAGQLEDAGAQVRTDVRPVTPTEEWFPLYLQLLTAAMSAGMDPAERDLLASIGDGIPSDTTDPMLAAARGAGIEHLEWMRLDERRHQVIAGWQQVFTEIDVMVAPAAPTPAFPHDQTPLTTRLLDVDGTQVPALMHLVWAGVATLPLLPGVVVPAGLTSGGLPVGVQVIAPRFADRTALAAARHIETLTGGFVPPPK